MVAVGGEAQVPQRCGPERVDAALAAALRYDGTDAFREMPY
jgi:hypothetical protein